MPIPTLLLPFPVSLRLVSHAPSLRAHITTKSWQTRAFTVNSIARNDSQTLTVAEQEWLQEDDLALDEAVSGSPLVSVEPGRRHDWRSTLPRFRAWATAVNEGEGKERRRFVKRVHPPQIDVAPGEPFFHEIQAYRDHFLPLLDAEQEEDEAVLKERLSDWSLDRLKEEGFCLTGLSAFWLKATHFGRPVASFLLGPGIALPDHRFENGTQVLLSRLDPLKEEPRKGSVVWHTSTQIRVSFPELCDLSEDSGSWRLDVGHTNIVFERMRTAIRHLAHDPSSQENASDASVPDRQLILQGTHLRDKLLHSFAVASASDADAPFLIPPSEASVAQMDTDAIYAKDEAKAKGSILCDDMRIQSWAARYCRANPVRVEGDPVLAGLNTTQIRAIAMMIGQRLSLVQGPPGTGKTKTIIEAIKLLKLHFQIVHPVLVATYTNVAVDNLVEGLANAGVRPLRVGYGGKVKTALYEHTLDAKLAAHVLRPRVEELTKEEEEIRGRLEKLQERIGSMRASGASTSASKRLLAMVAAASHMERQVKGLGAKIYAMKQEMLHNIVSSVDVICTTCVTSACVALNVIDFPIVFLDEASMSTEPASLIPLMKGSQQVTLIGDHKQLPPVIVSREAQNMGLGVSLFERLTEEGHVPSIMLDVQYRMHPAISRFPSSEFYQFSLQDGTVGPDGSVHPCLQPPSSSHLEGHPETGHRPSVIFLDHAGLETPKHRSRVNWAEAGIVCSVVEDLLLQNENLRGEDIGIIAPYVAQISLLTRLFRTDHRYRARFNAVLGPQRAMQLANVEIKTVDGFEGREKEVIIFSTVRNNAAGHIGFLADRRRLNVGLTRAKRGLFVVGSLSTLRNGKVSGLEEVGTARVGRGAEAWRRYAQFLDDEGLVVQLSGEKLRKTLYGNISDANVLARATY